MTLLWLLYLIESKLGIKNFNLNIEQKKTADGDIDQLILSLKVGRKKVSSTLSMRSTEVLNNLEYMMELTVLNLVKMIKTHV